MWFVSNFFMWIWIFRNWESTFFQILFTFFTDWRSLIFIISKSIQAATDISWNIKTKNHTSVNIGMHLQAYTKNNPRRREKSKKDCTLYSSSTLHRGNLTDPKLCRSLDISSCQICFLLSESCGAIIWNHLPSKKFDI